MPIFFQQDIDDCTRVGIWKIEENEEDLFLANVEAQRNVSHPHKRLQHLAGRYLLKHLYPDFPTELIRIADTRKPFLEDEAYHFSISHCGDYAAAIVSKENRVGVDIEQPSNKIIRVMNKFVSEDEMKIFKDHEVEFLQMITMIWSIKEAVFKWYGHGGLDFKKHIQLKQIIRFDDEHFSAIILFNKKEELFMSLQSSILQQLVLSYVAT